MIVQMRPVRSQAGRAMVSHLFTDDDYWWPYRTALCGREVRGDRLTGERLDMVPLCVQCAKHKTRVGAS